MAEFISHHATAVFSLLGVLAGGVLSFLFSWVLRRKDLDFKTWEKLLDRKLTAHETVVGLAKRMRIMVSLEAFDSGRELIRAPELLSSKETFDSWLAEFARTATEASTWVSTPVKQELNFVQDYLFTLHTNLASVSSESFLSIGILVRGDFLDLSTQLERVAFESLQLHAAKLRLPNLREHHKTRKMRPKSGWNVPSFLPVGPS